MNLPEFKALKKKFRKRVSKALCFHGVRGNGGGYFLHWGDLHLFRAGRSIDVTRQALPGRQGWGIYSEDYYGNEIPLGWSHTELIAHYRWCLDVIERRMVLDDIANV